MEENQVVKRSHYKKKTVESVGNVHQYKAFSTQQQAAYGALNPKQRAYVDYRGQGYGKAESYRMAGYAADKNSRQAAYVLEDRTPVIRELVEVLQGQSTVKAFTEENHMAAAQDGVAKTLQQQATAARETLKSLTPLESERVDFYRKICSGEIKSVEIVRTYDGDGKLVKRTIKQTSDVSIRMQAREKLDRLLGFTAVAPLGQVSVGEITINIVDASNHAEKADKRNVVNLDSENIDFIDGDDGKTTETVETFDIDNAKVENIDGEECIVVGEKDQKVKSGKNAFEEIMRDGDDGGDDNG